jgi:hypothetical protein
VSLGSAAPRHQAGQFISKPHSQRTPPQTLCRQLKRYDIAEKAAIIGRSVAEPARR